MVYFSREKQLNKITLFSIYKKIIIIKSKINQNSKESKYDEHLYQKTKSNEQTSVLRILKLETSWTLELQWH